MKTKNKILTSLVISSILASGLFATAEMGKKGDEKRGEDRQSCMMKKDKNHDFRGHKGGMLNIFEELNLTTEQKTKIEQIIVDSRKNIKSSDDAFSKDGFDKTKYIQIMNEKRDNMIKSQAEVIEKSYAILTSKQKEQLKVLMDLRKEKMSQKIEEKTKG